MRLLLFLVFLPLISPAAQASTNTWFQYRYTPILNQDYVTPKVLVDPQTKTIYYLESDGRHVTALSPTGRVIWHVEPAAAENIHCIITDFEFESSTNRSVASPNDNRIYLGYNCSAFGLIRKSDGVSVGSGQD